MPSFFTEWQGGYIDEELVLVPHCCMTVDYYGMEVSLEG